jgi:hypothetical protein
VTTTSLYCGPNALPADEPAGTATTIDVLVQLEPVIGVATIPLNVTVPAVVPKFVPMIVTGVPVAPDVGDKLVIVGDERTVNGEPLLAPALVVTTTLPVVARTGTTAMIDVLLNTLIVVAATPLNFTVLPEPNSVPVIVTAAPVAAEDGDRFVIVGVTGKFTVWVMELDVAEL